MIFISGEAREEVSAMVLISGVPLFLQMVVSTVMHDIAGIEELRVTKYIVRIGMKNKKSIELFKSLGFVEESVSEVFQEVTLALPITSAVSEQLASAYGRYEMQTPAL